MTSNIDYTLQNKKERFMKCLSTEINDTSITSKHFLNVLGNKDVSKLMESACQFSCPSRGEIHLEIKGYPTTQGTYRVPHETIDRSQRKDFLLAAIRAWFDDYDPEIAYEVGDFTSAVWFRYKQAIRHVLFATSLRKRAEEEKRQDEITEMRRCAALKRQEKEEEEYRKLGHGDIELGKKRFQERMRTQQAVKNTSEKDVSEEYLRKFREWLTKNPEWDHYGVDLADNAAVLSKQVTLFSYGRTIPRKTIVVPKSLMWDLLLGLVNSKNTWTNEAFGKNLNTTWSPHHLSDWQAHVTISWPLTNAQGFPNHLTHGYCTTKHTWSKLQGNDRISSPHRMHITGAFVNTNDQKILALETSKNVRKLLPNEYSKCENMTNAKFHDLRDCKQLPYGFSIDEIEFVLDPWRTSLGTRGQDFPKLCFVGRTMGENAFATWTERIQESEYSCDGDLQSHYRATCLLYH